MLDTGRRDPRKEKLTDLSLKALKANREGQRDVIWDSMTPGMAVRISAKGKKSFYAVQRRPADRSPVWYRLGSYPAMTLAQARERAREALTVLSAGQHPKAAAQAERRQALAAAQEEAENTFEGVAGRFIAAYLPTIRSAKKYESRIRRELLPTLGDKEVAGIRRRDVIVLLEGVAKRSGKASAMAALVVLRQLLNWALARDLLDSNPASAIQPKTIIGKVEARDRLLSDAELPVVWRAIDAVGEPFANLYRVLLLTGARREEIAAATWAEFDEANATLLVPAERSKNGQANLIPLSPLATKIVAGMPRFTGPHIFTTTAGQRPVGAHSAAKARLDAAIAAQGAVVEPFVVHDFRRVVRSNLGRLGVPTVVAELCLGHTQPGILGVYDQHSYFEEKKSALRQWEARLLSVVAPRPGGGDKVVAMAGKRRARR